MNFACSGSISLRNISKFLVVLKKCKLHANPVIGRRDMMVSYHQSEVVLDSNLDVQSVS